MERFSLPSTVGDVNLIFRTDKNRLLRKDSICLYLEVGMIGGGIAGNVSCCSQDTFPAVFKYNKNAFQ